MLHEQHALFNIAAGNNALLLAMLHVEVPRHVHADKPLAIFRIEYVPRRSRMNCQQLNVNES